MKNPWQYTTVETFPVSEFILVNVSDKDHPRQIIVSKARIWALEEDKEGARIYLTHPDNYDIPDKAMSITHQEYIAIAKQLGFNQES